MRFNEELVFPEYPNDQKSALTGPKTSTLSHYADADAKSVLSAFKKPLQKSQID
jgi:hypothetical protein